MLCDLRSHGLGPQAVRFEVPLTKTFWNPQKQLFFFKNKRQTFSRWADTPGLSGQQKAGRRCGSESRESVIPWPVSGQLNRLSGSEQAGGRAGTSSPVKGSLGQRVEGLVDLGGRTVPLGAPAHVSGFLPWLFAGHFSAAVNTCGPTPSYWPFRKGWGRAKRFSFVWVLRAPGMPREGILGQHPLKAFVPCLCGDRG